MPSVNPCLYEDEAGNVHGFEVPKWNGHILFTRENET